MNNTVENDFFGFPKVKWLQYKVRWANVYAIDVKFSQDLTYQKSLKSVNFWQSYWKNKKVDVFWDTVYRTSNKKFRYWMYMLNCNVTFVDGDGILYWIYTAGGRFTRDKTVPSRSNSVISVSRRSSLNRCTLSAERSPTSLRKYSQKSGIDGPN